MCKACSSSLKNGNVPKWSLVRVDTGVRPARLVPLTWIEELIVAPWRAFRCMIALKGPSDARPNFAIQQGLRGHVTAFPNPDPRRMATAFPPNPREIAKHVQVVLLTPAASEEEARKQARRVKPLHVRGRVVRDWVNHIKAVHPSLPYNDANMQAFANMDGVPDFLLHHMVYPRTNDDANAMHEAFEDDTRGYAGTRYGTAEEQAAHTPASGVDDADGVDGGAATGAGRAAAGASNASGADAAADAGAMADAGASAGVGGAATDDDAEVLAHGGMAGMDEAEVHIDVTGAESVADVLRRNVASGATDLQRFLAGNAVLGISTQRTDAPANDYDRQWLVMTHPLVYPHGTGAQPEDMSMEHYARLMLRRWPRVAATSPPFIFDVLNINIRHAVNTQAHVQIKLTPAQLATVSKQRLEPSRRRCISRLLVELRYKAA